MNPSNDSFPGAGPSRASGSQATGSQLYSPKQGYTPEEKHAVLGRHTVTRQNVSTAQLVGMGAAGGLVGATLGGVSRATTGCSWTTVAALGAVGAATFVLGTAASARTTPLAHAESELAQTEDDKACLLKRDFDNPDKKFDSSELYTIKHLSERYGKSWAFFKLLWDVLYMPRFQGDYENFLVEIFSQLLERKVHRQDIEDILKEMITTDSLAAAKALPVFQTLLRRHPCLFPETHDELARLMFNFSRLILAAVGDPRGTTPYDLYQTICRERYESFQIRIAEDESRLLDDILILRAIAEEDKASLSFL